MASRAWTAIASLFAFTLIHIAILTVRADEPAAQSGNWFTLFDGKSLDGWSVGDNAGSFKIENGTIIAHGPTAHLFYTGPIFDHNFKNFELKAEVMTKPNANSGIYFHTQYQEAGWPEKGYEAQVNNSQSDWRRTGSLYSADDVRESPAKDNEWFDYHIIVNGKQITLAVNGKTTVDYTEPDDPPVLPNVGKRELSSGTIALQAHDPGSEVHYRNIRIKVLP